MQDTIIKGTGNSRTLRTVPNAVTTYTTVQSLVQAMVDGTFPIDIGPLNFAGLDQKGNDLNKANLLKDTTAALFGLGTGAVPDEVLAAIPNLINARALCAYGSYVGANEDSKMLTFAFPPNLVVIGWKGASPAPIVFLLKGLSYANGFSSQTDVFSSSNFGVKWNANTVTITDKKHAFTGYANTYCYIAIG